MIKSFRRKRSSNLTSPSSRVTRVSTHQDDSDVLLRSPKKVIKALYDYIPQGPGELPFSKGDFFHVINDDQETLPGEEERNGWYEATNPITNARGMVPVSYFEVFNRLRPQVNAQPHEVGRSSSGSSTSGRNSMQTLYAVTLYEFKAEREDELDISPGENLIICAHHDYEWFIAKPINRLGGPGLVPALYVKIIDLLNPANTRTFDEDIHKVIEELKIPTVEQWKDQTAKYQASTIPLGSISNQTPPVSANSQYFQKDSAQSNRLSLSSTKTNILEASVDSYQLDHGRYQYLIIARLSNGKVRHLYRYYQDFYDLQVKLLELFPYEAGKIENSRRIIPSIPGPLINVNDSISKLRREKLDYYLRNLIALPTHISRSEEVLSLFEVLDNGFDKELVDLPRNRTSKPISQKSNYQQDRLSQYLNLPHRASTTTTPTSSDSLNRTPSSLSVTNQLGAPAQTISSTNTSPPPTERATKVKVKFYYLEDIFVLLLPTSLRLQDLKSKLVKRLSLESEDQIQLYLKNDYDEFVDENNIDGPVPADYADKLGEFEIHNDSRFHDSLYDKCKIVILSN